MSAGRSKLSLVVLGGALVLVATGHGAFAATKDSSSASDSYNYYTAQNQNYYSSPQPALRKFTGDKQQSANPTLAYAANYQVQPLEQPAKSGSWSSRSGSNSVQVRPAAGVASAVSPATPTLNQQKSSPFGGLKRFFSFGRAEQEPDQQLDQPKTSRYTGLTLTGKASWYGKDFHNGPTASGERYDMYSMTAAHKTLPFGTMVKVTNLNNGRDCVVRINNRGPYVGGRIIDLSKAAATQIGMLGSGVAKIKLEVLGQAD
ncbi:MAG: septal ring lytic transglycosylase RlpA family protein [Candidatus Sumerlaeaceae bacterium]|nr:septal ring lytic transglycosylase RlpA family protein [Candidatus Sumerlaeaceae bacterium]